MFSGDDEEEDDVPYLVNADSALLGKTEANVRVSYALKKTCALQH